MSCKRLRFVRFPALSRSLQRLQHVQFLSPASVQDTKTGDGNTSCQALAGDVARPSPSEASDGATELLVGQVMSVRDLAGA